MESGTLEIRNFLVLARLLGFLLKKTRAICEKKKDFVNFIFVSAPVEENDVDENVGRQLLDRVEGNYVK